jgi:hypothetical protein
MKLTDEQRMLRDVARDFAREWLAPHAAERDREEKFPAEAVAELGKLGFMAMRTHLPRRPCLPDLRGHQRHPAPCHCPRDREGLNAQGESPGIPWYSAVSGISSPTVSSWSCAPEARFMVCQVPSARR